MAPDEVDGAQRVIGFVVSGEDDDAIFLARETHDEVAHGNGADGGVRGKGVFFQVVALEVVAEELLGFQMAGAGGPARSDGDEFAGVVEGFFAVEVLGAKIERCEEKKEEEQSQG